jgi:hypothetical protein
VSVIRRNIFTNIGCVAADVWVMLCHGILTMMLMTIDTRMFLPKAATAVQVLPCLRTHAGAEAQNVDARALAARCMR